MTQVGKDGNNNTGTGGGTSENMQKLRREMGRMRYFNLSKKEKSRLTKSMVGKSTN